MQDVVKDTLSQDDFTKKYKVVVAIKAAKDMLSIFRTEERRKVITYTVMNVYFILHIDIGNSSIPKCLSSRHSLVMS